MGADGQHRTRGDRLILSYMLGFVRVFPKGGDQIEFGSSVEHVRSGEEALIFSFRKVYDLNKHRRVAFIGFPPKCPLYLHADRRFAASYIVVKGLVLADIWKENRKGTECFCLRVYCCSKEQLLGGKSHSDFDTRTRPPGFYK